MNNNDSIAPVTTDLGAPAPEPTADELLQSISALQAFTSPTGPVPRAIEHLRAVADSLKEVDAGFYERSVALVKAAEDLVSYVRERTPSP